MYGVHSLNNPDCAHVALDSGLCGYLTLVVIRAALCAGLDSDVLGQGLFAKHGAVILDIAAQPYVQIPVVRLCMGFGGVGDVVGNLLYLLSILRTGDPATRDFSESRVLVGLKAPQSNF